MKIRRLLEKLLKLLFFPINRISLSIHRKKNKRVNITIISRDCVGGMLYHQYGKQFLSPTINLFFSPDDFNCFCLHLFEYINGQLIERKDADVGYPVGLLCPADDMLKTIKVNFMHYKTFQEAYDKWEDRKRRICWNNIYVVSTFCYPSETAFFTKQLVDDFNSIPYKKVILVDKEYGFANEHVINKPTKCRQQAWLLHPPNIIISWKRTFNEFDFDAFFNR